MASLSRPRFCPTGLITPLLGAKAVALSPYLFLRLLFLF